MPDVATPILPTSPGLYVQRKLLAKPDDHIILPEVISKEPLGPLVRQEDPGFKDLAAWTHFCMVNAEEYGVSKANLEEMKKSDNPNIRRLLGLEANGADKLGVGADFCAKSSNTSATMAKPTTVTSAKTRRSTSNAA